MFISQDLLSEKKKGLFLDVDGTLLELKNRPSQVVSSRRLIRLLKGLSDSLDGALALVSGRSIIDLDRIFTPLQFPLIGMHGLEQRLYCGNTMMMGGNEKLNTIKTKMKAFAKVYNGIFIEDKGASIALHYRQCPQAKNAAFSLVNELLSKNIGLHLVNGKMVYEICTHKTDKGVGISKLLKTYPFSERIPIFIGDDQTDEAGFEFVNSVGGLSIVVGESSNSIAKYRLSSVGEVVSWLEDFLKKIKKTR